MAANTKNVAPRRGRPSLQLALSFALLGGCGASDPALLSSDDAGGDTGLTGPKVDGAPEAGGTAGRGGSGGSMSSDGSGPPDGGGGSLPDVVGDDARSDGTADASLANDGSLDRGVADTGAPDVCPANACGGCGALPGSIGGSCGTCGVYACDTGTKTLKCNDPGVTNMCPTWCTTHPAPLGVAAGDYQCLDFDNAMAPAATWPVTATGMGMVSRTNARASSPTYSLMASVTAAHEDVGTIAWNDVGATPITSISVSAAISPTTMAGVVPPSNGGAEILCLASGGNRTCLEYTFNQSGDNFTGFYVGWQFVGGAAVAGQCPLTVTNLTANIWSTVTLSLDVATHAIVVTINGTTVTSSCSGQTASDTVAKVTVGATTHSFNNFSWTGYFDNVQATVRR